MQTRLFILIIIGSLFCIPHSKSNEPRFQFRQFPYTDQLPSNSVQSIYKDKEGYMWFGTRDGLCRFDGYRIKTFRSNTANRNKLTNNNIRCIVEDNQQCLWIGTDEGINLLDKKTYTITPFRHPVIGRDRITCLCADSKGNVWIATRTKGIIRIDSHRQSHIYQKNNSHYKIPSNRVPNIYQDPEGNVWAMFWRGGLALYQPAHDSFKAFPPIGQNNSPFKMLEDKNHHYWVTTWGDGMFAMHPNDQTGHPFTPVSFFKNKKPVRMNNIIYQILQDSESGHIWIISFGGVDIVEYVNPTTFNVITSESMFADPCNKIFYDMLDDHSGSLWLGAVGEGIYKMDFKNNSFQTNNLPVLTKKLGFAPNVYHICEAGDNLIYLVIDRLGIYLLNTKTGVSTQTPNPLFGGKGNIQAICHVKSRHEVWIVKEEGNEIYIANDRSDLNLNHVQTLKIDPKNNSPIYSLYEDSFGNVWIGFEQGLYMQSADGKTRCISTKISNITSIAGDLNGNIWVGTDKQGVFNLQYNNTTHFVSKIVNFSEKEGNLPSSSIQSVCCDKTGNIYIGTREGSIYFFDKSTKRAVDISSKFGITEDAIMDLIEDSFGFLWISTSKKIIRYNPRNHVSTYYTSSDGIQVTSFSKNAAIRLQNGQIMFGGNKGLCIFNPTTTNNHSQVNSKVRITNIEVNNQSVFDNNQSFHFNSQQNKLILQPNDDNLSLEFSALNYSSADKIQYAYRLIGIDKDWVLSGNNRRYVNYTNLPAGRYTFEVKATDENGQWIHQITSLLIIKKPPFYQTWWAYLCYFILLIGVIWFIFNRIHLRNELRMSKIEKDKSDELVQTKLRYFTNISHDLLTPLTIISLLADEVQPKTSTDKKKIELIGNNAHRLQRLIKQILAFRKIDTGNMKLKVKNEDVVTFVREVCYTNFQPLIKDKNIAFSIESPVDTLMAWFDPDKLDKVLYNLLSNAFKFTPFGGNISVRITFPFKDETTFLRLAVSDNGEGILEKDLPHIFSRFYISNNSDQSQSNGIGLSLVRDLLQIHKGEISVESKPKEGATFTFEIPISKQAFSEDEIINNDINIQSFTPSLQSTFEPDKEILEEKPAKLSYHILVVEDNKELNTIITSHLHKHFTVHHAYNGTQAMNIIGDYPVDLIISDVMMPEMDGISLCRKLKSDIKTSHIDILLLTAKNSDEDQIDYFNAGADAYMPKPFDLKVLDARIANLIHRRQQTIKDFRKNQEINISEMHYSSLDEEFLKEALIIVEQHLTDSNFDYDQFADAMNSSKSTLYRKLKSLTSLSPGEFIRNVRLKHACKMLANSNDPISEIAYTLCFNEPKYFSKIFKAEFDITPSEYRSKYRDHPGIR